MRVKNIEFIKTLKEIIENNNLIISLACNGRSKFEDWRKFEGAN